MFDRSLFRKLARPLVPEMVRTPSVVPLPIIDGQRPSFLVLDQDDLGIDLAYERDPQPSGTSQASTEYWIPKPVERATNVSIRELTIA